MKIDQNPYQISGYKGEARPSVKELASRNENGIACQNAVNDRVRQNNIEQIVQRLKMREQKVIAHEMAHKAAGGNYVGAVSYEYQLGPDGKRYIVGGEVPIDLSDGISPEDTVQKMERVKMAALAPADPSPQDYAVAQYASMKEQMARQEIIKDEMAKKIMLYKKNTGGPTAQGRMAAKMSLYI
ncbi:MAG: putative metalloprotease CJM1_0395 family protein [Dissulfurimicrobium sp.]|uniref:putative metalloprotease CJM1_0395 family protein n=1 Tax=Dissulfurimicrobium sp. TaxID=2022436 RepID=UPI00404958EE